MELGQLDSILKKKSKIYKGSYSIAELPKLKINDKKFIIIVNTSNNFNRMGHWISLFINKRGKCIYFDSLNEPVIKEIKTFIKKQSCNKIITIKKQIQSTFSLTCGLYSLFFTLYLSYSSFTKFIKLFKNDTIYNDKVICYLTKHLFKQVKNIC